MWTGHKKTHWRILHIELYHYNHFVLKPLKLKVSVRIWHFEGCQSKRRSCHTTWDVPVTQHGDVPVTQHGDVPVTQHGMSPSHNMGCPHHTTWDAPITQHGMSRHTTWECPCHTTWDVPVTQHGDAPVTQHGNFPVTQHGNVPVTQHGNVPVTQHGNVPVIQHGNVPVTQHGDVPVTQSFFYSGWKDPSYNFGLFFFFFRSVGILNFPHFVFLSAPGLWLVVFINSIVIGGIDHHTLEHDDRRYPSSFIENKLQRLKIIYLQFISSFFNVYNTNFFFKKLQYLYYNLI